MRGALFRVVPRGAKSQRSEVKVAPTLARTLRTSRKESSAERTMPVGNLPPTTA